VGIEDNKDEQVRHGGELVIIEICIVGRRVTGRTYTFSNSNRPIIFRRSDPEQQIMSGKD